MSFPTKNEGWKRPLQYTTNSSSNPSDHIEEVPAKKKKGREFNFAIHPKRKIALQFFYYGWEHDGLVQQTNTNNTVEKFLMDALIKTKLIETWNDCDFSRCGRTDKGVSAFKQVAALVVRSCAPDEEFVFWSENTDDNVKAAYQNKEELSYVKMLNGVLPKSIRVTAWAPIPRDFSARHGCNMRIYKYSAPKANLNVEKMRDAASRLIGKHDFRNFCQIDMNEARVVMSYVREIYDVTISEVEGKNSPTDLIELTVKGSGFLWHMIRFIVTVLHEVGREKESPQIVSLLLDVEKTPKRPHYALAADRPLCLFDCRFDSHNLKWSYDTKSMGKLVGDLQCTMADFLTKGRLIDNMVNELLSLPEASEVDVYKGLLEFTQDRPLPNKYIPFEKRSTCDSLEEKLEKLKAKNAKKTE